VSVTIKRWCSVLALTALSACATLGGPAFTLGSTSQSEVLARKGAPGYVWEEADGVMRMFWPTGPYGTSTIMARFDAKQRLLNYEEVLDHAHFANVQAGMSMDEVTRQLGPSYPGWTTYFKARDELVWEWRYCDASGGASRFYVLFDGTSKQVRSTMSLGEWQMSSSRNTRPCGQTYIRLGPASATLK
jgi:hypothetical protein